MPDLINNYKELQVSQYLMDLDLRHGQWTVEQVKSGLRRILGEEPAIDIEWFKQTRLNEVLGEQETVEYPSAITVWYTTDQLNANHRPVASSVRIIL